MHLLCTDGHCSRSCRPFFLSESLSQAKRPQHPGGKGCELPSHAEMYRLRCPEAGEMHGMIRDFPPRACGYPEIWHPRSNLNQRGETCPRELPETKGNLWRKGSLPHQGYITSPSAQGHASRCHCLQATSLPRNAAAVGAGRPAEGGKCFLHTRACSSAHLNKATSDLATLRKHQPPLEPRAARQERLQHPAPGPHDQSARSHTACTDAGAIPTRILGLKLPTPKSTFYPGHSVTHPPRLPNTELMLCLLQRWAYLALTRKAVPRLSRPIKTEEQLAPRRAAGLG